MSFSGVSQNLVAQISLGHSPRPPALLTFGARHLCVEDLEGDEKHSGLHPLGASSVHPTLTMTIKSIYRHYRISTGQRKCPSVRHSGPQAK